MKAYLENKSRISAIITIPEYKPETFGRDLREMLQDKLTFDQAITKPENLIMVRCTPSAQYKVAKGRNPLCIDTDPVNATFYGFKRLNVRRINVMNHDEIDPRMFDDLIELITKAESDVIIDNGASTFVPMSHYLISNQIPALLLNMGHELVTHTSHNWQSSAAGYTQWVYADHQTIS